MRDLLIEIGCEELPPKQLPHLAGAFFESLCAQLTQADIGFGDISMIAAPRRFGAHIRCVAEQQPDKTIQRKGPALAAAYDKDGHPSKAALGFATSCGVAFDALETLSTAQGEWLAYTQHQSGGKTINLLCSMIQNALDQLPIAKRMRWGVHSHEFVRPIHWVLGLFGNETIPGSVLGITIGNQSRGHRFHHPEALIIQEPAAYFEKLYSAYVQADFAKRRAIIAAQIEEKARAAGGVAQIDEALLDEVAALVEWPVALVGHFEEDFLEVPHEALVSTMSANQKYFALFDAHGKLLPTFVFISNIESKEPEQIIAGNEKVIRPRFSDAKFFFEQDKKMPLADLVDRLKTVVFQSKLGTLHDKCARLSRLISHLATQMNIFPSEDLEAAILCKADLLTSMVSEFPELQGTMGKYYALNQSKSAGVADAIEEHYLPRFSGDKLPQSKVGMALAIADRADTIAGIFAINQPPTGDKDPFALRRAALGIIRIILEKELTIDLSKLFENAVNQILVQSPNIACDNQQVIFSSIDFVLSRLQGIYQDANISTEAYMVTRAKNLTCPMDFDAHIKAVHAVSGLPEIKSLASANKRIANILAKTDNSFVAAPVKESDLKLSEEKQLYIAFSQVKDKTLGFTHSKNYKEALLTLALLKEPVDMFFDNVMVNAEDVHVRNMRLNLLRELRELFLSVADISLLSISK